MNFNQVNNVRLLGKISASSLALLWCCSPALANHHSSGSGLHNNLLHHGGASGGAQKFSSIRLNSVRLPGHVSHFHTSRPDSLQTARTLYMNDTGRTANVRTGLSLDLSSSRQNIIIGSKLLGDASVTLDEGDHTRIFAAGSTATASEFAALTQKLESGSQGLILDGSGTATGGSLSLNSVSDRGKTIRASELVVPTNVSISGDLSRTAGGVRVTGNLVNHGSITASSDSGKHSLTIAAHEIDNEQSGLISSIGLGAPNLRLHADSDINNAGTIFSAGDLTLSAGGTINNRAGATAQSNGNLLLDAATINNQGTLRSNNQNITFSSPSELNVNNAGGTVTALAGVINIREEGYDGTYNSTVTGGDLLSQQLNIHAGRATGDVFADQLTGTVISTGEAAHVSSNSDLTLGKQCLTGDPTYFSLGNLILGGDITVSENLAIIAGGNITTSQSSLNITANDFTTGQGFNIAIIAGAKMSAAGSPVSGGTLPAQPPISQNGGPVTVIAALGGNIDLSTASGGLVINSESSKINQNGGDVVLAAFSKGFNGSITLPTNSIIRASGSGTGSNGNVGIFAGAFAGTSVQIGDIIDNGGAKGGSITIGGQPGSSDGKNIDFGTNGAITSGNLIVGAASASGAVKTGNLQTLGAIAIGGSTNISTGDLFGSKINVTTSGGSLVMNNISTLTDQNNGSILLAAPTITFNGTVATHTLSISASTSLTLPVQILGVIPDTSGNGGSLTLNTPSVIVPGALFLDASGLAGNGGKIDFTFSTGNAQTLGGAGSTLILDAHGGLSGGDISLITQSNITINAGGINAAGVNGDGAKIAIANSQTINLNDIAFLQHSDATGLNRNGGTLSFKAHFINFTSSQASPLLLSANGKGVGNGGTLVFQTVNTNNMIIGPLLGKLPKGSVDFLTFSARSGAIGGSGGSIEVETDGSMQVNPLGLDASRQTGSGNGASYEVFAGAGVNQKATLQVFGNLDASAGAGGKAGKIVVGTNNTQPLIINTVKTPKNGVMGILDATGNGGEIDVINQSGGVTIATATALKSADKVFIEAGGKGGIFEGKSVVITANVQLDLETDGTGSIGKKTLNISAPNFSAFSGGTVHLNNTFVGSTRLLFGESAGSFVLTAAGPLELGDISVDNKGNISVTTSATNGGLLKVDDNATLTANNGSLTLVNLDTSSGAIEIGQSATVETQGKGKVVTIAIGPAPKKGTNPVPPGSPPAGITVNNIGKGVAFFGPPGGVTGTLATVNATNVNVIFNNGSTNIGTKFITLDLGSVVTADPPSRNGQSAPVSFASMPDVQFLNTPSVMQISVQEESQPAFINASQLTINTLNVASIKNGITSTPELLDSRTAARTDLSVDATFRSVTSDNFDHDFGTVILTPKSNLTVKTPHGDVHLKANSVALISASINGLAVFNLDDRSHDSVTVRNGSGMQSLLPGQQVHVSKARSTRFEDINAVELVLYRGLRRTQLENGYNMFTSEFSIPSACYAVKPLRSLMVSKDKEAKKLADHLRKTAAILSTLRPDRGDFTQFFKPMTTAMR